MIDETNRAEGLADGDLQSRDRLWRRIALRWRWYHFYFLLAIFDVIVIVASLAQHHRTLTKYHVALNNISRLDETHRWLTALRIALLELNAPGNDIFETRQVDIETERFRRAGDRLRGLLEQESTYGFDLSEFRERVDGMLVQEERIFQAFSALKGGSQGAAEDRRAMEEASAFMASMDRHQANALAVLTRIEKRLQDEGAASLAGYGTQLERTAALERVFVGFVAVILAGVFWYGRQLQKAHDRMIADRQRAIEERHARLAAVGEVCSSVGHGIRNPLAAIMTSAQLAIEYGTLDEPTRQRIQDVLTEAQRLNTRVTQLLDFSRVPEQSFDIYDLTELVGQVVAGLKPRFHDRNITVSVDWQALLAKVYGNREQMAQCIVEVLSNSLDHVRQGGHVWISGRDHPRRDHWVELVIEDDGPGILPKLRNRVFDLFYSSKTAGNGIGLAFVKRAVELHSGTVVAGGAVSGGCAIVISLPLAAQRAARNSELKPL